MNNIKNIIATIIKSLSIFVLICFCVGTTYAQDWEYTVRPGDNLWSLVDKHVLDLTYIQRIAELNNIKDPDVIVPGTRIIFPIAWLKLQPAGVQVLEISGKIRVKRYDSEQTELLSIQDSLSAGDVVYTDADSSLKIQFADQSRLILRENSELAFDTLSQFLDTGMVDTRVRLQRGNLETNVEPIFDSDRRFEIHTPAATTAVRGTVFRVGYNTKQSILRTETLEGRVEVSSAGEKVQVPFGFGIAVEKDVVLSTPAKLLAAPDISSFSEKIGTAPVDFEWPAIQGAKRYRFQIGDDESIANLIVQRISAQPKVKNIVIGDPGKYFVRIRGIDAFELEGFDSVRAIEITATPVAPYLLNPWHSELVDTNSYFEWTTPESSHGFKFQLSSTKNFTSMILNTEVRGRPIISFPESIEPGTYFWRIAAIDINGDVGPFSEVRGVILKPLEVDNQISHRNRYALKVRWAVDPSASRYGVQIARDPYFERIVLDKSVVENEVNTERYRAGVYYIRVASIDAEGKLGPYGISHKVWSR